MNTTTREGRDSAACLAASRASIGLPLTETWADRNADLIALAIVAAPFLHLLLRAAA